MLRRRQIGLRWSYKRLISPEVIEEDEKMADDELLERTCNLSLADAIVAASSFKPSNPCIPTDPKIVSTLLSLVPPEPEFHDLISETSGQFDGLAAICCETAKKQWEIHVLEEHRECFGNLSRFLWEAANTKLWTSWARVDSERSSWQGKSFSAVERGWFR